MNNNEPIYDFDEWDKVEDYESDENSVILLDKNSKEIARFGWGGFTTSDLIYFKNRQNESISRI